MEAPVYAAASVRNSVPILDVLRYEFKDCNNVLEIGSGTGFHAITFAAAMPQLHWQTSDLVENHGFIRSAIQDSSATNVGLPLTLDVLDAEPDYEHYDAVYSCNTAHIMSFDAVRRMIALVGAALVENGVFCLYGPFKREGRCSTESNSAFDRSLRQRNPEMGIRDLEAIDILAGTAGMTRSRVYAMPTNNLMITWHKRSS